MSALNLVTLIALGTIFVLWAFFMFRFLWRLTKRSADRLEQTGGGYFRWMGHSLGTFREAVTSDKDRRERRRLIALTVLLIAVVIARPMLLA